MLTITSTGLTNPNVLQTLKKTLSRRSQKKLEKGYIGLLVVSS